MKKKTFLVIVCLCLIISIGIIYFNKFFAARSSIEAQAVRIAIIDSVKIKTQAKPFIAVNQLLNEQHSQAHKEILSQEMGLRTEYSNLKKKIPSAVEKQNLDRKVAELEQSVQKKQEKLSKQFTLLTEKLENEFHFIINEIVKEYGFNLVLNTTIHETKAILYMDNRFDITQEVIKRLDKKLPSVKLPEIEMK